VVRRRFICSLTGPVVTCNEYNVISTWIYPHLFVIPSSPLFARAHGARSRARPFVHGRTVVLNLINIRLEVKLPGTRRSAFIGNDA